MYLTPRSILVLVLTARSLLIQPAVLLKNKVGRCWVTNETIVVGENTQ